MFFNHPYIPEESPGPTQLIQDFCEVNFPEIILSPEMLSQLEWLQSNPVNTSQSSAQVDPARTVINIEIKRVLARLSCLKLLERGDEVAYQQFSQKQSAPIKLSFERFNQLSALIQRVSESPAAQQCLMATCFITKSKIAEDLAKEEGMILSTDSEQFITDVVTQRASFFPVCSLLSFDALVLLPFAFYKQAHARHMLDMEGGFNMIESIKTGIETRTITHEQFNLWFARWIINVAGLDGHVESKGSIYLTQPVADCMVALKSELDQLWSNPNYPVVDNYLSFRMMQLKVRTPYMAYLGALMRQYTPAIGGEIEAWFENLPVATQEAYEAAFDEQLRTTTVTSTFKPTMLVTLLALHCSVSETLTLFSQIELRAMRAYQQGLNEGIICENTPLCFRDIAFKDALRPILNTYRFDGTLPDVVINADAIIKPKAPVIEAQDRATICLR
jgi:hypothetical protein